MFRPSPDSSSLLGLGQEPELQLLKLGRKSGEHLELASEVHDLRLFRDGQLVGYAPVRMVAVAGRVHEAFPRAVVNR